VRERRGRGAQRCTPGALARVTNANASGTLRLTQPLPRVACARRMRCMWTRRRTCHGRCTSPRPPGAPLLRCVAAWRAADERFPFSRSVSIAHGVTERAPLLLLRRPGGATPRRRHARCVTPPARAAPPCAHTHTRANARTKHACVRSHTAHTRAHASSLARSHAPPLLRQQRRRCLPSLRCASRLARCAWRAA
jgi:hypothetical protein